MAIHHLDVVNQQLHKHESRLFSNEAQTALDFLDLGHGAKGRLIPSH